MFYSAVQVMEDADQLVEEAQTFLSETVSRLTNLEEEERRREELRLELAAEEDKRFLALAAPFVEWLRDAESEEESEEETEESEEEEDE